MHNLVTRLLSFAFAATMFLGVGVTANAQSFGNSNSYGKVNPNEVYALLKNFETVFMRYIESKKGAAASQIGGLKIASFEGKNPEDAFVKVNRISDYIDKLARRVQVTPVTRVSREQSKAIPAEVFLQIGNNLDTFVGIMIKMDPGKNWGDAYGNREY